jgi:invasion protein IalB
MRDPVLVGRYGLAAAVFGVALSLALPVVAAQKPAPAAGDAPAAGAAGPAPAAAAPAAAAPAAAAAGPAPDQGGGAPSWVKLCNTDPTTKKELCLVIQELHADSGQFIASATIRQITGEDKISFIAAVPVGMLIQPGLRVQIDTGKQYEVSYGICFPNACYGELAIDQDFITAMQHGKQVIVTTMSQQRKGVAFPMTLAGFKKVYESKGLDAKAAEQRQQDLNKALQTRAEEARKKLIQQQQKEGGGAAPAQ